MRREVVVEKNPKAPISETFRTLRTNLQFINSKKPLKTLLVTSTLPGEGKSWVTANLAVTFAKAGKKVLLIDADMRKGRQHEIFRLENEYGLSNYLSGIDNPGNVDISKYIQRTEEPNLFFIAKGTTPPNPSELLSSDITIKMIAELEKVFDLVLFDTTPCLIVTDAIILSRLVDSTLLVAEYNVTKKDNIAKIKKDIENVGGKVAGVVINKIPKQGKKYYGSSYYYNSNEKQEDSPKEFKTKVNREYLDLIDENVKNPENNPLEDKEKKIMEEVENYLKENRN